MYLTCLICYWRNHNFLWHITCMIYYFRNHRVLFSILEQFKRNKFNGSIVCVLFFLTFDFLITACHNWLRHVMNKQIPNGSYHSLYLNKAVFLFYNLCMNHIIESNRLINKDITYIFFSLNNDLFLLIPAEH